MRRLESDTSVHNNSISWGKRQSTMVPTDHCSNKCILSQKKWLLKHPTKIPSLCDAGEPVKPIETPGEVKATEVLKPTDYKKANMSQVVQKCQDLMREQQAEL